MSSGVSIDADLVKQQLNALLELFDQLESVRTRAARVESNQTADTWSRASSPTYFAQTYASQLAVFSEKLAELRTRVETMRDELDKMVANTKATDEDIQALFARLAARLDPLPMYGPYAPGHRVPGGMGMA